MDHQQFLFGFDFHFRKKSNIQRHWNIILLYFLGSLGGTTLNWEPSLSRPAPALPPNGFPVAPWRPRCRAGWADKPRRGGPGPGAGGPEASCRYSLDPSLLLSRLGAGWALSHVYVVSPLSGPRSLPGPGPGSTCELDDCISSPSLAPAVLSSSPSHCGRDRRVSRVVHPDQFGCVYLPTQSFSALKAFGTGVSSAEPSGRGRWLWPARIPGPARLLPAWRAWAIT